AATELIRACSCGGGGALDHAVRQRCSTVQGESQARTSRRARGQDGAGGSPAAYGPPLSAAGVRPRRCGFLRCGMGEPGGPAEAECAVDQDLVAADGDVGADLEVGPAELVLDLLVALLDPVPDAVNPGDLGQAGGLVDALGLARAAGPGQVGDQVPGGLARQGARVGGDCHQAPDAV